jgi:hypothetical protein
MAYTKQTWTDGANGGTPITAARLQNIENGIFNADFQTCTSTTRPTTGLFDGMHIYETDTKAYGFYDATAAKWVMFDTQWQSYQAAVYIGNTSTVWTMGNGTSVGRYYRTGRKIDVAVEIVTGTTTTFNAAAGAVYVNFPPGYAPANYILANNVSAPIGGAWVSNGAGAAGFVCVPLGGTPNPQPAATRRFTFYNAAMAQMTSAVGSAGSWNIWSSAQQLHFQCSYETAFEA